MHKFLLYRFNLFAVFITFYFLFFMPQFLAAQKKESSRPDDAFTKYGHATEKYSSKKPYYIGAWRHIPTSTRIVRHLDDSLGIIEVDDQLAFEAISKKQKIAAARDTWKLAPPLEMQIENSRNVLQKYILTALNTDRLLEVLKDKFGSLPILFVNTASNSVVVQCNIRYVKDCLLPLKEVIFIDKAEEAHSETGIIGYNRSLHGINAVDYSIQGANGKNMVVGVKEQKMDQEDLDLWKRVLPSPIEASSVSNHATVIASIIGGAGNSFYDGRGIAWGCMFFPSSFSNLFADDSAVLHANRVTVQNHSYGTIIQQFYGAEAVSYDVLTWQNKKFIPVMSSGNQGQAFAAGGKYANISGFANLTGNFKMAKNIITVGAIDNNGMIAEQSSAGPLYDGRIAPQIMALGPNGTSDAAAIVTGSIAVMQQVYADSNSKKLPNASLLKAILYNTAEDISSPGIDYKTGYGLLNSYAAITAMQQKNNDEGRLSQGQQWVKNIAVPPNAARLKVTLAWTDSAAMVNNNKALVNDLDLEVKEISSGKVYQPWVLNTSAHIDSLTKQPVRARDSLNTAEQVSIHLPLTGLYEIKVKANATSTSSSAFDIAYRIDTLNTFTFTSPQHASDVNRAEDEILGIRWKTYVADTNQTGNLYISYDYGIVWHLLKQSVKIADNQYQWEIKDTNSVAVLKMETAFGVFLSNTFIIGNLTRTVVDFNCADSFRLSWNKHIYANAYQVFALTDSPYLKSIYYVTDTFVVLQRSVHPWLIYAVEPVLNNGLPAARSVAINIQLQGVECFYKTLNYNLLDGNKLNLILELSVADYADSIFFEQVSPTGQFLQNYGAIEASDDDLIYSQQVNEINSGITYVRARIKLKSGLIVYTGIIPVLTSGTKRVLFYPNPVNRRASLKYVLQQGVLTQVRLQLYDVHGRLLKSFLSMPDNIDVSAFSGGVVIYKLLDSKNRTLETGKIVIQ